MATVTEQIVPTLDRILVQRMESLDVTQGGIFIPEKARLPKFQGTVVAVGPGKIDKHGDRIPVEVHIGQEILFRPWVYDEVPDDPTLVLVKADDVVGILTDD